MYKSPLELITNRTLLQQGIHNLYLAGLTVEITDTPNLSCNLQIVKTEKQMTALEMLERIDLALTPTAEMTEFWKPVILFYSKRKAKKTDLNELTTRLLKMGNC